MGDTIVCKKCSSEHGYFDGTMNNCPECGHAWMPGEEEHEDAGTAVRDSNGTELVDGDTVTVIKDLPVKGSSMVVKRGTKVKGIRLTDDPEHIEGKVEGSSIYLKTIFLKKG